MYGVPGTLRNSITGHGVDYAEQKGLIESNGQGQAMQDVGAWMMGTGAMGYLLSPSQPGTKSLLRRARDLRDWYYRGSENDAYWRSLSWKNRLFYEFGQKTLPKAQFTQLKAEHAVARGRELVAKDGLWKTILGIHPRIIKGETLRFGPTPGVRWFYEKVMDIAASWQIYSWMTGGGDERERR